MLTSQQRSQFDEQGFLCLGGAFDRADAAAMEDRLWGALGRRHGVRREDPTTWSIPLASGLQSLRAEPVFDPIGSAVLREALDGLIGRDRWGEPKHWGQFLVSFPPADGTTATRALWHTDFPYTLPVDRVVGALVFSFLGEVPPGSGGTLAIAGSPAVVRRFLESRSHLRSAKMRVVRQALMSHDPWLAALGDDPGQDLDGDELAARFGDADQRVGDLPVRVVELTDAPGDVIIGHPWLLHSPAPHRGRRPRFMRVQRIHRAGSTRARRRRADRHRSERAGTRS